MNFTIDIVLPYFPSDELGILGSEIEDNDLFCHDGSVKVMD